MGCVWAGIWGWEVAGGVGPSVPSGLLARAGGGDGVDVASPGSVPPSVGRDTVFATQGGIGMGYARSEEGRLTLSIAQSVAFILWAFASAAMRVGTLLTWPSIFVVAQSLLPSCGVVGSTTGGGEGATMRPPGVCVLKLGGCQRSGHCCQMLLASHLVGLPLLKTLLHHQLVGGVGGDADPLFRCAISTYWPIAEDLAVEQCVITVQ